MNESSEMRSKHVLSVERAIEKLINPELKLNWHSIPSNVPAFYYDIVRGDVTFDSSSRNLSVGIYTENESETDQLPPVVFDFSPKYDSETGIISIVEMKEIISLGDRLDISGYLPGKLEEHDTTNNSGVGYLSSGFDIGCSLLQLHLRFPSDLFLNEDKKDEATKVIAEVRNYLRQE